MKDKFTKMVQIRMTDGMYNRARLEAGKMGLKTTDVIRTSISLGLRSLESARHKAQGGFDAKTKS